MRIGANGTKVLLLSPSFVSVKACQGAPFPYRMMGNN